MLKAILFLSFTFLYGSARAQIDPVRFDQLEGFQKKEKKLVMVFIETDWCKYCKAMKQTISRDIELKKLLKENFYTVVLNAEEKSDIAFAGKVFSYKPSGVNTGVHQLAEQLGRKNGQLSYPTVCFLNEDSEIIYQYSGYLPPKAFAKALNIVSGNQTRPGVNFSPRGLQGELRRP
jgi:thioredoxin-related protein